MKAIDYVGKTVNGIKIEEWFTIPKSTKRKLGGYSWFHCICICGNKFTTRSYSISSGKTKSCGCLKSQFLSKRFLLPNNQGAVNEIYRDYSRRAVEKSIAFEFSKEEFREFIFSNCHYCGIEPQVSKTPLVHHKETDECLSYNGIDRVDPAKGYTISNCVPCCWQCNCAKSQLSIDNFIDWVKRISTSKWYTTTVK